MKTIKRLIECLAVGLLLISCHEYEMVQYGDGGQINFIGDYYLGQRSQPYWVDDTSYLHYEMNFGMNPQGDSLRFDTVVIGVQISGVPADFRRKVVFKTMNVGENAVEVLYPEEYYMPADTGMTTFKIVLKRPAERNKVYTSFLVFDYEHSDFTAGTLERQKFRLVVQDVVNMELWGCSETDWDNYYVNYLGAYSETKQRYLITKYGAYNFQNWTMSSEYLELFNSNGFYTDYEDYKKSPGYKPLIDENTGEEISFPII